MSKPPCAQPRPPPLPQRSGSGVGYSGGGSRGVVRQLSVQLARGGGPFRRTHGTLREAADDSQGGFLALRVIRELANSAAKSAATAAAGATSASAAASDRDSGFATVTEDTGGVYESLSGSSLDEAISSGGEDDVIEAAANRARQILRRGSVCVVPSARRPGVGAGAFQLAVQCQRRPSVPDSMGSLTRQPRRQPQLPMQPSPPPPPPPRRRQPAGPTLSYPYAASNSASASIVPVIWLDPPEPSPPPAGADGGVSDSTIPRAAYAEQIRQAQRRLRPQQKQPQAARPDRHSSVCFGAGTARPPDLPPRKCRRDSSMEFHQDSYILNRSGFARSESGGQFQRLWLDRDAGASPIGGANGRHQRLISSPSLPVSLQLHQQQQQQHQQQQQQQQQQQSFVRLSLEFNDELRAGPNSAASDSSASPESSPSLPARPFPQLAERVAAAAAAASAPNGIGEEDVEEDSEEEEELLLMTPLGAGTEEPPSPLESLERLRANLGDVRRRLAEAEADLLGGWRRLVMERCQASVGAVDSYDRYLSRLGPLARLRCQLDRRGRRLRHQQQQQQQDLAASSVEADELRRRGSELERQLVEARQLAESAGRNRRRLMAELGRRLAPDELMKLREAVRHRMRLGEQAELARIRVLCAQEQHVLCYC